MVGSPRLFPARLCRAVWASAAGLGGTEERGVNGYGEHYVTRGVVPSNHRRCASCGERFKKDSFVLEVKTMVRPRCWVYRSLHTTPCAEVPYGRS